MRRPIPGGETSQAKLVRALGLPTEIVPDAPHVTLSGRKRATVLNHQGIEEFSSERVAVRTSEGLLTISGERLALGCVTPEEISVEGYIASAAFSGGEGESLDVGGGSVSRGRGLGQGKR